MGVEVSVFGRPPGYGCRSASGASVELHVSDVRQFASGGSYVVKYQAEVDASPGDGVATIELVSTVPNDADGELLRRTIEAIRRGAESVLRPRRLQARLRLHQLVIHPIDCNPSRFESATGEALGRVLAASAEL